MNASGLNLKNAAKLRDIMRDVARKEVERLRPPDEKALVTEIDTDAGVAHVLFPSADESVPIRMTGVQPSEVDQVVTVSGPRNSRFISQVFGRPTIQEAGDTLVDHGSLSGLEDDDHPQYALAATLAETIRDTIGTSLVAGSNIDVTVNDAGDTITIDVESLTSADITDLTESVQDLVGGMVTGNSESGVTVTYDDTNGKLDFAFTVDMATQTELDAAVAAEAVLARNASNLTGGTVADARIASTIARDTEVTAAIATHEAAVDPHPAYLKESDYLAIPDDGIAPAQVTGVTLVASFDQILVYWTANTEVDMSNGYGWYQIQVDTENTFAVPRMYDLRTDGTAIVAHGLADGVTYYFRVRAIDAHGNAGTYSATVSAPTIKIDPGRIDVWELGVSQYIRSLDYNGSGFSADDATVGWNVDEDGIEAQNARIRGDITVTSLSMEQGTSPLTADEKGFEGGIGGWSGFTSSITYPRTGSKGGFRASETVAIGAPPTTMASITKTNPNPLYNTWWKITAWSRHGTAGYGSTWQLRGGGTTIGTSTVLDQNFSLPTGSFFPLEGYVYVPAGSDLKFGFAVFDNIGGWTCAVDDIEAVPLRGNVDGPLIADQLYTTGSGTIVSPVCFPGLVVDYAGDTAPPGWLMCYGQAVSRTTYLDLFRAIGVAYGVGDGSTTFNVPDYRGRVGVGMDNMGNSDAGRLTVANVLGTAGGAQTHQLTVAEIPAHNHDTFASAIGASGTARRTVTSTSGGADNGGSSNIGGSGFHNNMQPYIIVNKLIRAV